MKKIILSVAILSTILSLGNNVIKTNAEVEGIEYKNNAYQICDIQNNLTNLFLGDSIYNSASGTIRMKNSLRLKNPNSKKLTLYFEFKEDISSLDIKPFGEFYLSLTDDEGNYLISYAEQFQTLPELKETLEDYEETTLYYEKNVFVLEFDTSNFPDFFILGGDELEDDYDHLQFKFVENTTIQKFMLSTTSYEDLQYSPPTKGLGADSLKIYNDNDSISYIVNYDNRISLDEIKQDIIAYDYFDNEQITPSIELDEYTPAINENKLGTFSVKLKATDASDNSSTISIYFKIEDTTKPVFAGEKIIEIDYNDLPENKLLDLTQYVYATDNHEKSTP